MSSAHSAGADEPANGFGLKWVVTSAGQRGRKMGAGTWAVREIGRKRTGRKWAESGEQLIRAQGLQTESDGRAVHVQLGDGSPPQLMATFKTTLTGHDSQDVEASAAAKVPMGQLIHAVFPVAGW